MQLQHLKSDNCPDCGARTKSESQNGKHCNGSWFENKTYDCGASISFVPNFMREEITTICPDNPNQKKLVKTRQKFIDDIKKFVDDYKVDAKFKDSVKDRFTYLRPS